MDKKQQNKIHAKFLKRNWIHFFKVMISIYNIFQGTVFVGNARADIADVQNIFNNLISIPVLELFIPMILYHKFHLSLALKSIVIYTLQLQSEIIWI